MASIYDIMRILFLSILLLLPVCLSGNVCSADVNTDDASLQYLTIGASNTLQVEAGKSIKLTVGKIEQGGVFIETRLPVKWTVDAADGITLNPKTGEIKAGDNIAGIKEVKVSASIDNGKKLIAKKLYVYNPLLVPLIGIRSEQSHIKCSDGSMVVPDDRIGELEFRADGTFSVTWHPFEYYQDYWGTYVVDYKRKRLEITPVGGNYMPQNIIAKGEFKLDEAGMLTLKGLFLGNSRNDSKHEAPCGQVFK